MTAQQDIAVVNRYVDEVWNKGNLAAIDELLAADYRHGSLPPHISPTRDGLKQFAAVFLKAFPDIENEAQQTLIENDWIVQRWTGRGSHQGEFMGLPPTHKAFSISGISMYRLADGKIVEDYTQFDMMGLMQQLGAVPQP